MRGLDIFGKGSQHLVNDVIYNRSHAFPVGVDRVPVARNAGLVLAGHELIGNCHFTAVAVNRTGQDEGGFAAGTNLLKTELGPCRGQLDHSQLLRVKCAHASKDLFSYNLGEPASIRVAAQGLEGLDR